MCQTPGNVGWVGKEAQNGEIVGVLVVLLIP
jgi:hypothetical protein